MKKKRHSEKETIIPRKTDSRVGSVVVSLAGHDAGLLLVIVAGIDDRYVLVADGKRRKLISPKKKKMQHLKVITKLSDEDTENLRAERVNDAFLRRILSSLDLEKLTQDSISEFKEGHYATLWNLKARLSRRCPVPPSK